MCVQCWEEYGREVIDNPAVRAASKAADAVYEFSCVGGNLHVLLDDWNLDDSFFDGGDDDYARSIDENIHEAGRDQLAAERYCLGLFRALTEAERASALALRGLMWSP